MPANLSVQGWVARTLAKARASLDGGPSDGTGPRMNRYQEQMTGAAWVGEYALCDEGCLMMASMLPGATALQYGIVTANTTTTAGMLVFCNNAPAGPSSPRCHLREIHFTYAAPANNAVTSIQYSTVLDTANRAPSTVAAGATSPAANAAYAPPPVCTNMDETPTIVGKPYFPLSTSAAAGVLIPAQGASARVLVGNGILRANIPATLDDYRIVFGATDRVRGASTIPTSSTTAGVFTELHPAVTVGPQEYFVLSVAFPGTASNGPTFSQMDMSWIER